MEALDPKDLQPKTMLGMKLIQQPFSKAPAAENLFDFDTLKQTRDTVSHHLQFSQLLMVVQGRKGSGKNSFANSLIVSEHPALYYFNATAESSDNLRDILTKAATNNHADDISILEKRFHDIMYRGQQPVLIINDAEQLNEEVLREAINYSQGIKDENQQSHLKLLLLGDHGLETKLETNGILNHNQFYIIDLPQLNVSNTRAFLMHRLGLAGYRDAIPFSDKDITDFFNMANGNPEATLVYAAESLNKNKSLYDDDLFTDKKKNRNRLILAGVLLFTGAFVYNSLISPEKETQTTEVEKLQLPPGQNLNEKSALNHLFQPSNNTMDVKQSGNVGSLENNLGSDKKLPEFRPEETAKDVTGSVFMDEKTEEIIAPQIMPAKDQEDTKNPPEKTASSGILAPTTEEPVKQITPVKTETKPNPKPVVTTKPAVKEKPATTQNKPAAKSTAQPVIDEITQRFINAGTHSPEWILQQNSSKWSLQILAAHKPDTLLVYVNQHKLGNKVAYYRTRLGKQDWHVILYGQYDSKEKAKAVIPYLPAYIRENSPWPKDLKSVQNAIRQSKKS